MSIRPLVLVCLALAACGDDDAATPDAGGGGADADVPPRCVSAAEPFTWPVPTEDVTTPPHASWKHDLDLPAEPFLSPYVGEGLDEVRWIKFTVLLRDPTEVYFQDSAVYPFHYEFATERLAAFQGLTREQFDEVTLRAGPGQEAVLGAVLVPSDSSRYPEYGVQLVIEDDVHPELVKTIFQLVVAHVRAPEGTRPFYVPNAAQARCLDAHDEWFAAQGIDVASVDRWLPGDACYSPGWAIGKLVRLGAAEVDAAYLDGRLRPEDILLLDDAAPAELPYVGGVVTLAPSTPNSHPAILARSYGVPFVYARRPEAVAAALALAGRHVVVRTRTSWETLTCQVQLIDVEHLDEATRAAIRALGAPPPLEVTPAGTAGVMAISAEELAPADIGLVGGKAAHFGLLRDAIPEASPTPAIAFTFDLWRAFLAQPAPGGAAGTLGDEIARRLAPHAWPPDLLALDQELAGVRAMIEAAPFPAELAAEVNQALAPFDPARRIRFRSSTNVEDGATFTGAGLYDSATGCLADDLDGDAAGPSACNAAQPEERGAHRAVKKVFASFYRRNAVLERMRRGVAEADVGMALLVHYSVPDEEELANGVATFDRTTWSDQVDLVTQLGAVSVTNPDGSAQPEVVQAASYSFGEYLTTIQGSSLVTLGDHVLVWEDDYRALLSLLMRVADRYEAVVGAAAPFTLDLEYKKVAPGVLSVKQVRPLPLPDTTEDVTPFLVGAPTTLCVFQGESSDVWALHRLKAKLALDAGDLWLTGGALAAGFYDTATIDYAADGASATLAGDPATFPGASHAVELDAVTDGWTAAAGAWTLTTRIDPLLRRNECPVVTPGDLYFSMTVEWQTPVAFIDWTGPATRTTEYAELTASCPDTHVVEPGSMRVDRVFEDAAGLRVETSYWFPPPPRGATAGYTAPLMKWVETRITGLTSEPIVLHGYFAQTYRPWHHNFGGDYIFEPRLDPEVPAGLLAELAAQDIAFVFVEDNYSGSAVFWAVGLDGALRML